MGKCEGAGKQKPLVEDPSQLDEELSKWVV